MVGVWNIATASERFTLCRLPGFCCVDLRFPVKVSATVTVGHNEHPVPSVGGANGTSRKYKYLDGIADSFKASKELREQQVFLS